jgi:eukaryotic-like serine/threonine-protein kinase
LLEVNVSLSRTCVRCLQPLPDHLSDGSCPSCGTPFRQAAETPAGTDTPNIIADVPFEDNSNQTATHVPATVYDNRDRGEALPYFPDIPNHTDFEIVGRGGMGTVYRAIQRPANRTVAVKVMNAYADDETMKERFIGEIRALAKVRHPGVVAIFEVGTCSHGPYFTMEYVTGGTVADRIKKGGLDDREAARIVAEAADAVHEAHREGILHRDIKPSNILLDDAGRVKVSDFGLAKDVNDRTLTQDGAMVGTVPYMAPEQATGVPKRITKLSDVYCLGSTLFHLLTGRPPRDTRNVGATIRRIQKEPVPPPRAKRPDLCTRLDAIVHRCMAHEPQYRFPTAAALASELRRWSNGEQIETKPLTRGQKAVRFLRRHRVAVAMVVLLPFLAAAAVAAAREMDPKHRLERELLVARASGATVDLLDAQGRPRIGEEWLIGESKLSDIAGDGGIGFQTQTLSLLNLLDDPKMDEFDLTLHIRHYNRGPEDSTSIGIFMAHDETAVAPGRALHRWLRFSFSDFLTGGQRKSETLAAKHAAFIETNWRINHEDGWRPINLDRGLGVLKFRPSDHLAKGNDWRELKISVRANSFEFLLVETDTGTKSISVPRAKVNSFLDPDFAAIMKLPNELPKLELKPFNLRGGIGIFAIHATAMFKNVRIAAPSNPIPIRSR